MARGATLAGCAFLETVTLQATIDRLTKAWREAGHHTPLFYGLERDELKRFAAAQCLNDRELLRIFRAIVEQAEEQALAGLQRGAQTAN